MSSARVKMMQDPKVCQSCGARYTTDALFCPNDGTPLTTGSLQPDGSTETDPYLGREIGGHIEIRQLAGVGAMGRVYRAFQKGIDRDVAVKVLHRELSANQQLVARFHREAKVASRLQHPNVVQVHLAGQLPDGALYIVMEYLDGMSLQSALAAAGGSMPLPRALHIGLQICDAVGEAHAQGIVHRDLKPENVMLVRRGEDVDYVKVLDFGIARLNWGEQSMATAAGLIFGTARYISPEGAQGEAVGPGGDVYAIATLLFQLLAGRTPFEGEQAVALLVQQIHDKPPALKSIARAAYLPDVLAEIIMDNLAKAPADRAGDGRVLGRLLVEAAKAAGMSADDLMSRSALLGARPSAMQLAPLQRTRQLSLDPEMQQRLSPETRVDGTSAAPQQGRGPHQADARSSDASISPRTLAISPATRPVSSSPSPPVPGATGAAGAAEAAGVAPNPAVEPAGQGRPTLLSPQAQAQRHAGDAPPAASTTKWAVPAELQKKLSPAPAPVAAAGTPGRAPAESSVDPTLDDDDGTVPPPPMVAGPSTTPAGVAPLGRSQTEFADPIRVPGAGESPFPGATLEAGPAGRVVITPGTPAPRGRLTSGVQVGSRAQPDAQGTNPGVEEDAELSPRRSRSRQAAVIFLCFMIGVGLASFVLYQMGRIGPASTVGSLDDYVARASAALRQERWDDPPRDNVRDITSEALTRWPRDPRILDIRARATDELVKEAVGRKFAGDLTTAQHLAHLAKELDPSDTTAQHLVEEYDRELKSMTPPDPMPVVDAGPLHISPLLGGPRVVQPGGGGPRATLDVSTAKPRVGQPVTFVARVASAAGPKARVEEPHFRLDGPGLVADTRLTALAQGYSAFQTSFTFFEAGKYEVGFNAKVDGAPIKVTRIIVVEDEGAMTAPLPPAVDGGKWL